MKVLFALFLVILPGWSIAQTQKTYAPIDSVGWELPDLSELEGFERSDLGSVTYLLVLNKSGEIRKVKVLSSSFAEQTELMLRNQITGLTLAKKKNWTGKPGHKGKLEISMGACMDERDSKN